MNILCFVLINLVIFFKVKCNVCAFRMRSIPINLHLLHNLYVCLFRQIFMNNNYIHSNSLLNEEIKYMLNVNSVNKRLLQSVQSCPSHTRSLRFIFVLAYFLFILLLLFVQILTVVYCLPCRVAWTVTMKNPQEYHCLFIIKFIKQQCMKKREKGYSKFRDVQSECSEYKTTPMLWHKDRAWLHFLRIKYL